MKSECLYYNEDFGKILGIVHNYQQHHPNEKMPLNELHLRTGIPKREIGWIIYWGLENYSKLDKNESSPSINLFNLLDAEGKELEKKTLDKIKEKRKLEEELREITGHSKNRSVYDNLVARSIHNEDIGTYLALELTRRSNPNFPQELEERLKQKTI